MHMPWDNRGQRSDEHIDLLRAVWTAEGYRVDFSGRFYSFGPIDPDPRPIQTPPPILVGGHSPVAMRRAGTRGDGWIATGLSPQRLTDGWDAVRRHAELAGRDPDGLALVNSVRVKITEDPDRPLADPIPELIDRLDAYRRLGVNHLMLGTRDRHPAVELAAVELLGREVAPALA